MLYNTDASCLMRYALFLLFACATTATAQEEVTASSTVTSVPRSRFAFILTGGASQSGPAIRLLAVGDRRFGRHLSVGLSTRFVGAFGAYPLTEGSTADELYTEFGVGLRPAYRLSETIEVAASAGYGIAILTEEGRYLLGLGEFAYGDLGFTVPIELEASVHISDLLGLTTAISRSFAVTSWKGSQRFPEGAALDHWTATVGVRLGRW
ncbi:MAG: hypothetical protein Rubg2KO_12420 [Rubricoccaceae bacterium]